MSERKRLFFGTARSLRDIRERLTEALTRIPYSGGEPRRRTEWSKCPLDPLPVEKALKHLRLKEGIVLHAYQFRVHMGGNCFVYALPAGAEFPPPERCPKVDVALDILVTSFEVPRPPGSLAHFMEAFEGDRSPESFFEASIVLRELNELGAFWHGISWGRHKIIDADPFTLQEEDEVIPSKSLLPKKDEDWEWPSGKPSEWRPCVEVFDDGRAVVRFYTYSALGSKTVYLHTDTYSSRDYVPERSKETIGRGPTGYVF